MIIEFIVFLFNFLIAIVDSFSESLFNSFFNYNQIVAFEFFANSICYIRFHIKEFFVSCSFGKHKENFNGKHCKQYTVEVESTN